MTMFAKIQKALRAEDACVISKKGVPLYAVMTHKKYRELMERLDAYEESQKNVDKEKNANLFLEGKLQRKNWKLFLF